jgi:CheY-like chemotaxis protein
MAEHLAEPCRSPLLACLWFTNRGINPSSLNQSQLGLTDEFVEEAGSPCIATDIASQAFALVTGDTVPDVAILDVRLPDWPRPASALRTHQLHPHVHAVFVSGWGEGLADPHALADMRWEFLRKPFKCGDLGAAVTRLLPAHAAAGGEKVQALLLRRWVLAHDGSTSLGAIHPGSAIHRKYTRAVLPRGACGAPQVSTLASRRYRRLTLRANWTTLLTSFTRSAGAVSPCS